MPKKRQLIPSRTESAADRNTDAMHKLTAGELGDVLQQRIRDAIRPRAASRFYPRGLRFKFDHVEELGMLVEHRLYRRRPSYPDSQRRQFPNGNLIHGPDR